jgi:hypothetical protein
MVDNLFSPHSMVKHVLNLPFMHTIFDIGLVFTNKDVRGFSRLAGNFWSLNKTDSTNGSHKVAEEVLSIFHTNEFFHFYIFVHEKSTNYICRKMSQPISRFLAGHEFSGCLNRGIVGSWDQGHFVSAISSWRHNMRDNALTLLFQSYFLRFPSIKQRDCT